MLKKWIFLFLTFIIMSVLCLFEADAEDINEFFIYSMPRSADGVVRQVLDPPANTNDSIQYLLYTPNNTKEACFLQPTPEEFDDCPFDPSLETKMLIPGYLITLENENSSELIKDALLKHGPYNVIYVDWSRHSGHPYPLAVKNTVPVGKNVAEFIKFVKEHTGAGYDSFHLIGHSLGAHVCGIVGKQINKLARITGLDPAGPLYELEKEYQLYHSDAEFVDVIHTSDEFIGGLGKFDAMGHMDFYPNGGRLQPACKKGKEAKIFRNILTKVESPFYFMMCNHMMSLKYFLNSIHDCDYMSTKCEDFERLPICSSLGNPTSRMGFFAKRIERLSVKSKFYLNTSESEPFC